MGRNVAALVAACAMANAAIVSAFVPTGGLSAPGRSRHVSSRGSALSPTTARTPGGVRGLKAMVDPGMMSGVDPAWLHSVVTGIADATGTVLEGTGLGSDAPGVADIAAAAGAVAEQGGGGLNLNPVELLTQLTENSITGLHNILSGMGVPAPYGLSIIFFTLLVKAITFPLTYTQLSSTTKMQTLQPKIKDIQARFANNPEAANQAITQLYQTEQVNPLAGCLPALAQIPIFISLYRSLLNLAKENKLTESFLWIPSLEGPTFDAPPTETLSWIKDWTDGAPRLGWHDTLCYLTIPLILVVTQSLSMQINQPAKDPNAPANDTQEASQAVLKFLPLMIGWFALSVPSALGLYWILNNAISTGAMYVIKKQIAEESGTPAPKMNLPFSGTEDAEVVSSVTLDALPDREGAESQESSAPEQSTGYRGVLDASEVEGEILNASPAASRKPKPKRKKRPKKTRK